MAATKRKKPRSAAQKAATRKLVALNKGKTVSTTTRRKRRAPAKRKTVAAARRVVSRAVTTVRKKSRRSVARAGRGAGSIMGTINSIARPAISETVGAVGLDVIMGYASPRLPLALQSGAANTLVKASGAVLMGVIAAKLGKRGMGVDMARGALVVTLHNLVRTTIQQNAPSVPLGIYDEAPGLGEFFLESPRVLNSGLGRSYSTRNMAASAPQFALTTGD